MKKEFKIAILIFLGFLSLLWIEKPLRELLSSFQIDDRTANNSSGLVVRVILIFVAYHFIKKLKFEKFTGLDSLSKFTNIQAIFIPLMFILMGLFSNWKIYLNSEFHTLLLFGLSVLAVGVVEEFIFRGAIFPLCIKALRNSQRPILIGAILSSSLFGIVHFINLFSQPANLVGITSQVFFALSIGVFFSGLLVRTENIAIPAFIHALVNFSFGAGELRTVTEEISTVKEVMGVDWSTIIPTTIFFAFIFAGGVYMILNCNEKNIIRKLDIE